ncbi:MAG: SAM-dependent methyltransferase [Bacteroidia bacterium]|nr:SAM-dependent methyltransferase [Bacteroidia bacterium]MDW8157708.1 SAM-dependent methyltransferase [Bacteroidia bacterium]
MSENISDGKGKLYLIPTPIHPTALEALPEAVKLLTLTLRHFIVESQREARRFLFSLHKNYPQHPWDFNQIELHRLNWKNSPSISFLQSLLAPTLQGHSIGLLSDCGAPTIADPGSSLVNIAHQMEIPVIPLVGPSALVLALMASGLNGQSFQFHGYLPTSSEARKKKILLLEKLIQQSGQTQIFIETPYRNQILFTELLKYCSPSLLLCIAVDLHGETETIRTLPIEHWRKKTPELHKKPTTFLLGISPIK